MTSLLFILFATPQLLQTIPLKTNNQPIFNIKPFAFETFSDGSFLITTKYIVYHFDQQGHQITKLGRKGQGPGEFQQIRSSTWNGPYYILSDARTLTATLFDEKGVYLKRQRGYFKTLFSNANGTFYNMGDPIKQFQGEQPLMVGEVEVIDGEIKEIPPRFHRLSQEAVDIFYNYSFHYVVATPDNILVLDEVKPEIFVYDPTSKNLTRSIPLKLPKFWPGPDEFPKRFFGGPMGHRSDYLQWENSWSRFLGLASFSDSVLVSYNAANGMEQDHSPRIIVKYNLTSGVAEAFEIGDRLFIGSIKDRFYLFEDWDDSIDDDPT